MEKITLTRIIKKTEDRNGKPYIGRNGKRYARASIQCNEYGAEYLNGFFHPSLIEGAQVDVEITEREWNGKTYKDFKLVSEKDKLDAKYEALANEITGLKLRLNAIEPVIKKMTTQLNMKPTDVSKEYDPYDGMGEPEEPTI